MDNTPMTCRRHALPRFSSVRVLGSVLWISVLLVGVAAGWAPVAEAQITFSADLTDEARSAFEEREEIDAETMYELVSDGFQFRYEGAETLEVRFLVFFIDADGTVQGTVSSEPFEIEPGEETRGERVPREDFLVRFEEVAGFPWYPSIPAAPIVTEVDASSPIVYEFEDAWRESEDAWPAKWGYVWAQTLAEGMETKELERKEDAGMVGFALVPGRTPSFLDIIGRYLDPEAASGDRDAEIAVRYVAAGNRGADR